MNCRLASTWAVISPLAALLLLACPQVLDDGFHLPSGPGAGLGPIVEDSDSGISLDAHVDAGILGDVVAPPDAATVNVLSHVVSSVPVDGARGVLPNSALQIGFSAPMDRKSVEAAYSSSDLPASDVTFTWSDGDTVLHIQPKAALRSSAGSDPASVSAVSYALQIGSKAHDRSGHPLAAKQLRFSVARAITQLLGPVQDRNLTGNWRSDGIYGLVDCERVDTTVCVGDSISTGEPAYRGFMTFDLGATPADAIEVSAAQLGWTVSFVYGMPFSGLGALQIEHVSFSAIGDAAFSAPALPERQSTNTILLNGDTVAYEVLPAVQADWGARHLLQFRLAFDSATDGDGALDQLGCDWSSVKLALTYWLP